ncbi:MAG: alcohol dehydrogenase catalytic domain-containing protein [Planctomycetota bacterium]
MKQAADTTKDRDRPTAAGPMRALRLEDASPRLATDHPRPDPGPNEALIRTRKAAVSAVDLELCRGLFDFTGTLGHEFVGTVESINGDDRPELAGARVVGPPAAVCGRCDMCVTGLSNHCRHKTVLGMQGRDGCLADWLVLPANNLVPVPDSVGPLGLLMVQVMAKLNASVRLIGRYSEKLALCEKWRVKHRHVDDIGRRADQDIVVDCTGAPAGLDLAVQLVRPRGTIVLKTIYALAKGVPADIDRAPIVMKEITLLGSRWGPTGEAMSMIARGAVDVVSLIGKRMTLNDGRA